MKRDHNRPLSTTQAYETGKRGKEVGGACRRPRTDQQPLLPVLRATANHIPAHRLGIVPARVRFGGLIGCQGPPPAALIDSIKAHVRSGFSR